MIYLVALFWFAGPAWAQAAGDQAVVSRNIDVHKAALLVRQGAPLIDVRTPEELVQTGRIEGAINILHTEVDRIAAMIGERKDRAVVLYCRSGRRVSLVIDALRARGFEGLVNAGGFADFSAALQPQ
jgi:phage shock protein E